MRSQVRILFGVPSQALAGARDTGIGTTGPRCLLGGLSHNCVRLPADQVQIRYGLTEAAGKVRIAVINIRGQTVFEIVRNDQEKGYHEFTWNRRNGLGQQVASGVYFILVEADGRRSTKRVSLIR
jgi:flagellar hook assembly protein FlgD